MIDIGLARRYVQPLFEVASEKGKLDSVANELNELNSALGKNSPLKVILSDPSVSRQSRIAVIEEVFTGYSEPCLNFIRLVIDKNRTFILEIAYSIFKEIKDESEGLLNGVVESALPLNDETITELKQQLEKSFGHKVDIEFRINPEILGGLRIRVGNTVMDGSITGKLESLKSELIGA